MGRGERACAYNVSDTFSSELLTKTKHKYTNTNTYQNTNINTVKIGIGGRCALENVQCLRHIFIVILDKDKIMTNSICDVLVNFCSSLSVMTTILKQWLVIYNNAVIVCDNIYDNKKLRTFIKASYRILCIQF